MTPSFSLLNTWADRLIPVTHTAGRAILDVRAGGFEIMKKADTSPVTEADQIAEGIVVAEIEQLEPTFPIVAEERVAAGRTPVFPGNDFWLIDALDGTKEFIREGSDFTVNVALVCNGVPVFGIVHAPARGETYVGICDPAGDAKRAEVHRAGQVSTMTGRPRPGRITITGSKSHEMPELMEPFLAQYDVADKIVIGSSLKFCLVAEGAADLYPRFGPTCEWDTGAGHAVLRAAGGRVHTFDGAELAYKKPQYLNGRFLAEGPT